jgi:Rrf2 family protein
VKISTRTEYGMRVMITLARNHGTGPLSLAGIARREKLPHAYLEQLVGDLRRAGLVRSTRGASGGYQLTREPALISLADAMRALEGPLLEMPCAGTESLEACDRPSPCSVHDLFQRVFESLSGTLGATTLADVALASGGPPYPIIVRKRRAAQHAASSAGQAASHPTS